jgi:positive regulator of sigma E activity
MTRVTGTVVAALDGQRIVVDCSAAQAAGCAACGAGRGCRAPWPSGGTASRLTVDLPRHAPAPLPGATVALEASAAGLLRAAARLYLPPFVGLLLGPLLLRGVGVPDGAVTLAAAVAGLSAGFAIARAWSRSPHAHVRLLPLEDPAP